MFIDIHRELGVDGQIDRPLVVVLAGQLDGKLDPFGARVGRADVGFVLVGGQHLFEQALQLHFAEGAAVLDIAQHLFQAAHVGGQVLHLAQAFLHVLELLAHQLERLADALVEGLLQFFIDRGAHFFQFLLGDVGQPLERLVEGRADFGDLLADLAALFLGLPGGLFTLFLGLGGGLFALDAGLLAQFLALLLGLSGREFFLAAAVVFLLLLHALQLCAQGLDILVLAGGNK